MVRKVAKSPAEVTLDELFAPDENMTRYDKMMLTRARRSTQRIAYKRPYNGPQREVLTVADLMKFRVEVGAKDFIQFIDKQTGDIYEPLQFGDSVLRVVSQRMKRMEFSFLVEHVNATKRRRVS